WWAELPPADVASWGQRAARRKGQKQFRLAFIASKFRVGREPDPFIVEIDLSGPTWTIRDVTDEVDVAGAQARQARREQEADKIKKAAEALVEEITERHRLSESPLVSDRAAVPFLQEQGLSRFQSRKLLREKDGVLWRLEAQEGMRGNP